MLKVSIFKLMDINVPEFQELSNEISFFLSSNFKKSLENSIYYLEIYQILGYLPGLFFY
jgi:hypothetical protein